MSFKFYQSKELFIRKVTGFSLGRFSKYLNISKNTDISEDRVNQERITDQKYLLVSLNDIYVSWNGYFISPFFV